MVYLDYAFWWNGNELIFFLDRLATYEATAEYLHSLGVNAASSLLEALSFSGTQKVNLRDLVAALHEEMNASLDAGILTNSGHSGVALHTGIVLMQQELSNIR